MKHSAGGGVAGVVRPSPATAGSAGALTVSRWTTAWSPGQQSATSHSHQVVAECPVCFSIYSTEVDFTPV